MTVLFSQPHTQVVPLDRLSRFMAQTTCFRKRCLFRNRTIDGVIRGKYAQNPLKVCVNKQFQAKTLKYKNHTISEITKIKQGPSIYLMGVLPSSQSKSTTADDRRFCCVCSDSDEIWQAHTESNADDDESIKVEPEV